MGVRKEERQGKNIKNAYLFHYHCFPEYHIGLCHVVPLTPTFLFFQFRFSTLSLASSVILFSNVKEKVDISPQVTDNTGLKKTSHDSSFMMSYCLQYGLVSPGPGWCNWPQKIKETHKVTEGGSLILQLLPGHNYSYTQLGPL